MGNSATNSLITDEARLSLLVAYPTIKVINPCFLGSLFKLLNLEVEDAMIVTSGANEGMVWYEEVM